MSMGFYAIIFSFHFETLLDIKNVIRTKVLEIDACITNNFELKFLGSTVTEVHFYEKFKRHLETTLKTRQTLTF